MSNNIVQSAIFVTYADVNYRDKAQVLIASLVEGGVAQDKIHIISLDDCDLRGEFKSVHQINWSIISDIRFEKREDYFRILPQVLIYLNDQGHKKILYLDCDVKAYFQSIDELSAIMKGSVSAVKHNRFLLYQLLSKHPGYYNIGVNWFDFTFNETIAIVEEWNHQCSHYKDHTDPRLGYFSEQLLIDSWPNKLRYFNEINETVYNQAIWNTFFFHISYKNDRYCYKGNQIVFYHFSTIKYSGKFYFFAQKNSVTPILLGLRKMYIDYIHLLRDTDSFCVHKSNKSYRRLFLGHEFR